MRSPTSTAPPTRAIRRRIDAEPATFAAVGGETDAVVLDAQREALGRRAHAARARVLHVAAVTSSLIAASPEAVIVDDARHCYCHAACVSITSFSGSTKKKMAFGISIWPPLFPLPNNI